MPNVTVWVDAECDGECDSAEEYEVAQGKIDDAIALLRAGDTAAALCVLTGDDAGLHKLKDEIVKAYDRWKRGKLPGFTNYEDTL